MDRLNSGVRFDLTTNSPKTVYRGSAWIVSKGHGAVRVRDSDMSRVLSLRYVATAATDPWTLEMHSRPDDAGL